MTADEAIRMLSLHLMQCGALMPIDWITTHGEGSPLMEAFQMAIAALREKEELHKEEGLPRNLRLTPTILQLRGD